MSTCDHRRRPGQIQNRCDRAESEILEQPLQPVRGNVQSGVMAEEVDWPHTKSWLVGLELPTSREKTIRSSSLLFTCPVPIVFRRHTAAGESISRRLSAD